METPSREIRMDIRVKNLNFLFMVAKPPDQLY
jgi:hypothetical protein